MYQKSFDPEVRFLDIVIAPTLEKILHEAIPSERPPDSFEMENKDCADTVSSNKKTIRSLVIRHKPKIFGTSEPENKIMFVK